MKLLLATGNAHKVREIRDMFHIPGLEILTPAEHPVALPGVEETGATFQENAVLKAVTLALASGLWTMADDSGLEVDALDGAPGVRSARFAGEPSDDAANNALLLRLLAQKPGAPRTARFRCVLALSSPSGRCQIVEGACEGAIAIAPRGSGGFGYDPLFVPNGHERTFGELSAAEKNGLSHRALALQNARATWETVLRSGEADWPARRARPMP